MLQPGMRLGGRYRLDFRVGAGGMGEVWRAVDEVLGRTVAVKAMLPEVADQQDFARRFVAEAQAMAGVSHSAVASIHDYGHDAGVTFLVMEFIDGESLAQAVARLGRIRPEDTMRMIAQAADALQAVHDTGIVHRDVKPANLLVRRNGAVVLTDFGISRADDATGLTLSGAVLGTPTYLSPEQVLGHPATPLSDVFSLGVAAYECVSGRKPFAGDNPYAVALARVHGSPPPLPADVPPAVVAVVERAMAQDPAHRWPSAAAMAEAARVAAGGGQIPPSPASFSGQPFSAPPASGPPVLGQSSAGASAYGRSSAGQSGAGQSGAAQSSSGAFAYGQSTSGPPAYDQPPVTPWPQQQQPMTPWPGQQPQTPWPGQQTPWPGQGPPAKRPRWPIVMAAISVLAVIAAGVVVWQTIGRESPESPGASGSSPGATSGETSGETSDIPSGFDQCEQAYCPTEPLCWGGLLSISGRAQPPAQVKCTDEHSWETFVAIPATADMLRGRQDELLKRKDVGAACSADVMLSRTTSRSVTKGWTRDAWPIQINGSTDVLIHCIASAPSGVDSGESVFS